MEQSDISTTNNDLTSVISPEASAVSNKSSKKFNFTKPLVIKILSVVLVLVFIAVIAISLNSGKKEENNSQETGTEESDENLEEDSEDEEVVQERDECELVNYQSENFSKVSFKYDPCEWQINEVTSIQETDHLLTSTLEALNNDNKLVITLSEVPGLGGAGTPPCFQGEIDINKIGLFTRIKRFNDPQIDSYFKDYNTNENINYRYFTYLITPESDDFNSSVERYLQDYQSYMTSYPVSFTPAQIAEEAKSYKFCMTYFSQIFITKSDRTFASLPNNQYNDPNLEIGAVGSIHYIGDEAGIELADEIVKTLDFGE